MDYKFEDFIKLYQTLNSNEWITVFEENPNKDYDNDIFTFCAMLRTTRDGLKEYLSKFDWEFSTDNFGKATFGQDGDEDIVYLSGQEKDDVEYLIAIRYFDKLSNPG